MRPSLKEKNEFNKRFIELRKAKQLTQVELAKALGVTRDVIAYYESKAQNPGIETLQSIADFFNVSPDFLLGVEPTTKKRGAPSKLENQLNLIKELPKDQQKAISTVLDMALKNISL